MKRMLLIFAHPSDESFVCAATIAKYVKAGWNVDLVCATFGQLGSGESPSAEPSEKLGFTRKKELEAAASLLGIASITFLGYTDGTLTQDPSGALEEILRVKMAEVVPDIVITYDTLGLTNNPDNVRLCYSTTYAFQKYASWIDSQLRTRPGYSEEDSPKLYYACMPESAVEYMKKKEIYPDESYGKPFTGTADKFITTVISTQGAAQLKKKALRLFTSQKEEVELFVTFQSNPFLSQEYFIMRYFGIREIFMGKNDRVSSKL